MTQPATIRAFIAVTVPAMVIEELSAVQARLTQRVPEGEVRWSRPDGMHLTLRFLGDITARQIHELQQILPAKLKSQRMFHLQLADLGGFPNIDQPRVLWVGLGGNRVKLNQLKMAVDSVCDQLGFTSDHKPFVPHLTLGRVRKDAFPGQLRRIGNAARLTAAPASQAWRVRSVHLYKSDLQPDGAVYTSLGEYGLRLDTEELMGFWPQSGPLTPPDDSEA